MKEFNLSDWISEVDTLPSYRVQEFIMILQKEIKFQFMNRIPRDLVLKKRIKNFIDKLAGDVLK